MDGNIINGWANLLMESSTDAIMDSMEDDEIFPQPDQMKRESSCVVNEDSSKPNVIFCDIDGVLVDMASQYDDELRQYKREEYRTSSAARGILAQLCEQTNSKIVIMSSWNYEEKGTNVRIQGANNKLRSRIGEIERNPELKQYLFKGDYKPTYTVNGNDSYQPWLKPVYIKMWLEQHGSEIDKFVVLDDLDRGEAKWKTNIIGFVRDELAREKAESPADLKAVKAELKDSGEDVRSAENDPIWSKLINGLVWVDRGGKLEAKHAQEAAKKLIGSSIDITEPEVSQPEDDDDTADKVEVSESTGMTNFAYASGEYAKNNGLSEADGLVDCFFKTALPENKSMDDVTLAEFAGWLCDNH